MGVPDYKHTLLRDDACSKRPIRLKVNNHLFFAERILHQPTVAGYRGIIYIKDKYPTVTVRRLRASEPQRNQRIFGEIQ